ncbi:putative acetyltransferase [Nitratireductor aquibiodomus]|uniref:Putative acetyltransferase n=1 Tax=Nitratireductor aquibiodomus TaxID=204799 RepID=A0A1H4ILD9_9HYPH|nr:acetyltransferase [Nitratireductor aquibiodomus]SEB34476.1 putative acetyltransferase [Nitratireductor aquibiodomus]
MPEIRKARKDDLVDLMEIWRRSVRATHDFLSESDFRAIEADVAGSYLPEARLWVAVDGRDSPLAFMGLTAAHIDSLFVDPDARGKGLGAQLVTHARQVAGRRLTLEVNEQNEQALGFYQKMGFTVTGRSPRDGDGRPYPLLHMSLRAP